MTQIDIFIMLSDGKRHLEVDGDLALFDRLLLTMRGISTANVISTLAERVAPQLTAAGRTDAADAADAADTE